ncbi:hypothetical protein HY635_04195 [Candidatus Uhrbacteria bacterium]|nr:hypothetical protein [Candidatus Uhrbacteria bacterium]
MKSFDDRKLAKNAASAAMLGVPLAEARDAYVTERLGACPTAPVIAPPPDCSVDQQALAAAEQQLTAHLPPPFLYAALACLFVVEAIGCALLMASLGFENPSRTMFGIMFAAAIFLLTYVAARLGSTPSAGATAGAPPTQRWFYGVLAAYAVIIIAITVLRVDEMPGAEEGSRTYDLAAAIIMMCATIGPAWLAEVLMQRLLPMIPLIRTCALHRRRIADAKREYARAVAGANAATVRAETRDHDAEQLRAMYETRYTFVKRVVDHANGRTLTPAHALATHGQGGTKGGVT